MNRNKFFARVVSRRVKRLRNSRNMLWNLLQGYDSASQPLVHVEYPDGDLSQTPTVTPYTFAEIKARIDGFLTKALNQFTKLNNFLDNHPHFRDQLINWLGGETALAIKQKLLALRNLYLEIQTTSATATSLDDYASHLDDLQAPVAPTDDVDMDAVEHEVIIANDLLDAISYALRNIHWDTGQPLGLNVNQRKGVINNRFIKAFDNCPIDDSEGYITMRNYIVTQGTAATTNAQLIAIANYIDANVEKLPVERRDWAFS